MKRSITILNLSDLHICADNKKGAEALQSLSNNLHEYACSTEKDQIKWQPDYIVIPGDIIDSETKTSNVSYDEAAKIINTILSHCEHLKQRKERVIAIPGNHDKLIPHSSFYEQIQKNFDLFCSREKNETIEEEFVELHEKNFLPFSTFYKDYCPDPDPKDYHYFCYSKFKEKNLKYVSGLKVFDEHKVCFLCVNSEWLYTGKGSKQELHLCTPIIKELTDELAKPKYSEYTVVTLIHRKPDDLSWQTKNHTDERTYDALRLLEQRSHVLITGHEHPIRTNRPDMIKNSIQHFKIGSPSATTRENERFPYSFSEIIIDPINLTVELLAGSYNDEKRKWKFDTEGIFPLREKFVPSACISELSRFDPICLKTSSIYKKDVEEAIQFYFGDSSNWKLTPLLVEKPDVQIEIPPVKTHFVLYAFFPDDATYELLKKAYNKLISQDEVHKAILLNRLIISILIINPRIHY